MTAVPTLSVGQWRKIEPLLAANRRDRRMITALLFRETTAVGLRDVCSEFQVTRSRLSEWHRALAADGTLALVMKTLRLEPAGALMWSGGGVQSWRRGQDAGRAVMAVRLRNFRDSLR
jgi:hypothetical protein